MRIIFSDFFDAGDGILKGIMLIEVILRLGKKASELRDEVQIFKQLLVNVKVKDKKETLCNQNLLSIIKEVEATLGKEGLY